MRSHSSSLQAKPAHFKTTTRLAAGVAAALLSALPAVSQADEADRRQALFGDVHIHTQLSFDAYIFGIRRTPDDAYRYALGETLRHAAGYDIALKGGPLDFYAVTDHAEYLGVLPEMNNPANSISKVDSADGMDALAIPHNSNLSDGLMFQLTDFDGNPMTSEYAQTRMRNEPIVEMTQVKGTSDTHPALSPNDEFAGFEIYETLLGTDITGKTQGGYVREALLNGLKLEEELGVNPYQFGLIGSSDSHNAGGPVEEDHYFGKTGLVDGTPERRRAFVVPGEEDLTGAAASSFFQWSAAGLAGVWAERNNREDIFAAMRRKETFATSGPRIKVRLFAGYDYPSEMFGRSDFATLAYAQGVPMGGEPDAETNRCADNGKRIDVSSCEIPEVYGAAQFDVTWSDPDFDPERRAFYYARVIENPTCRWSTWEANRRGEEVRDGLPLTLQERAWSSPIWVKPQ